MYNKCGEGGDFLATIKDIAKLAGVSQGTVSNVLNGSGNVSSEKILRVHAAAKKLGYTPNQKAQLLRRGNSNLLSVMIPNISDRQYADFYISFRNYAESMGYRTAVYLHDGSAEREAVLTAEIRSELPAGIAVISSVTDGKDPYIQTGFSANEVLFVEQRPFAGYDYVGFDYFRVGQEMGKKALSYATVALVTGGTDTYVTNQIKNGFFAETQKSEKCRVRHYEKENSVRGSALSLEIFSDFPAPDAVFCVSMDYAKTLRSIHQSFYDEVNLDIFTVSPLFPLPETDFYKYELNYRLLGKISAEQLIARITGHGSAQPQERILQNTGFRDWQPKAIPFAGALTVMTLDSPTATSLKNMARMYTRFTGVPIRVAVFPYDGVHEILTSLDEGTPFDIIRLDVTWMSRFAPRIYEPLKNLDDRVEQLQDHFLPGLMERYSRSSGVLYAIPETPSTQMLFYRKDLFENTTLRRLYKEQNREPLVPPVTFAQYNRIARFFTKNLNPSSPIQYGSTLTLGNTGVAATEFLTRYFALTHDLFDEDDHILLSSANGIQALKELLDCRAYTPPMPNNWWRDTAGTFAKGDVAMTILHSNYASELTGQNSSIRDKIGFAMVPGENPLFGGGSIGVCKYSKQKELAYHFIRWLCGEDVSTAMMLLGSVSPCISAYDNYQVIDTYPWLSMSRECFEKTDAKRLPHHMGEFDERRFLSILGIQVINAISGACGIEDALNKATLNYEKIMN